MGGGPFIIVAVKCGANRDGATLSTIQISRSQKWSNISTTLFRGLRIFGSGSGSFILMDPDVKNELKSNNFIF